MKRFHLPHPTHSIASDIIIGLAAFVLVASGTAAMLNWRAWIASQEQSLPAAPVTQPIAPSQPIARQPAKPQAPASATLPAITEQAPVPQAEPAEAQAQAYWLQIDGEQIRLVPKAIALEERMSPEASLKLAFHDLLQDGQTHRLTNTIPSGTDLLDLKVTSDGIHINLSQDFEEGGGSSSMIYRVAQVLFTATSLDPNAKVYLSIDGQPLDEDHPLGGEGMMLSYPMTRQAFIQDFSLSEIR